MAKGERFCTKSHSLCTLLHKPKLFRLLTEGYYMKAPGGRRGIESAFCQPRISMAQAQGCATFQAVLAATLPQAAMMRLIQGVIAGTLGEEPGEVRTSVHAEERRAHAPEQTPCKRVRLTQATEGDAQAEGPGWP